MFKSTDGRGWRMHTGGAGRVDAKQSAAVGASRGRGDMAGGSAAVPAGNARNAAAAGRR